MSFKLFSPNGQSWEIDPNLANRSSIITTCVRRYYFENTYYALLACVDYHVPDRVFYDYTVTRQEGTFPLSSQRDYEILHYMMEAYPIPVSHYIECEKKLQHMASKIKHMQGMAKDLVADMKTRTNKDTDRKSGTYVAGGETVYHTAKQTPEYEPKNTTATNMNLVRLQKLQCLASKLKQLKDTRKGMVTNLNKNTTENTDRKECTHVTSVDQASNNVPGNSSFSCITPASPPNIKNWDSKFKQMQDMAKNVYANYMKRRANEDIDRKAAATIANAARAENNATKQTPDYTSQKVVSCVQTPATLQKLKDLASKLEHMQELYISMKKGTHKDMDRKVNVTIANVEETVNHTAKQTTEFQTASITTSEAKHQSPVTPPNIRNWDSKFSYMQKMAKDIYADFMKNRTHEGVCLDEKKRC